MLNSNENRLTIQHKLKNIKEATLPWYSRPRSLEVSKASVLFK